MEDVLDLVIVGAGPAGIAASIYASRARLSFVLIEKYFAGGQIINTYEIENYPGIQSASGFELGTMFREHAEKLNVEFRSEDVHSIETNSEIKIIHTDQNTYKAKTLILATGASHRELGASGEKELQGKGVSYCATCDGAFYKDKVVAVIGGGDVAVEDAIYLARMCKKVYLIHRRDELRAVKVLGENLSHLDNVEILWNTEVDEIIGDNEVESIQIRNNSSNQKSNLEVNGVFIAVGNIPNTKIFEGVIAMDDTGFIQTDEECETSIGGIFAAGDLRVKSLRQVLTAASDGAVSVYAAEKYLMTKGL